MEERIQPEIRQELVNLINRKLHNGGKILCLSLTGSRAFGWADERMDYDIHGIFACKDYWDWVHYGKNKFDINLYELDYLFTHLPNYLSFPFFQSIANPIYVHPDFDYQELMSFCTLPYPYNFIAREINALKINFTPRAALHGYRILMLPIHFFKTRTFELNIFKINEKYNYNFTMLPVLKEAYLACPGSHGRFLEYKERKAVCRDLKKLMEEIKRLYEGFKGEKVEIEKIEKWKENVSKFWI